MPLKISLGFRISEYALSIGGPEGAIKSQTPHYVNVGPGAMKSGDIAKQAKAMILRKAGKEDGQKIKKVIIGEIQRWIPAGTGMLHVHRWGRYTWSSRPQTAKRQIK
jgi:hypothetical protein